MCIRNCIANTLIRLAQRIRQKRPSPEIEKLYRDNYTAEDLALNAAAEKYGQQHGISSVGVCRRVQSGELSFDGTKVTAGEPV